MTTRLLKCLILLIYSISVTSFLFAQETTDNSTYYYNNFETAVAGNITSLGAASKGNANRISTATTIDASTASPLDGSVSLASIKPATNAIGAIRWNFTGNGTSGVDLTQNDWEWDFVYTNNSTLSNDDPDQMAVGNNSWRYWLYSSTYNGNKTQGFYISHVGANLVLRYRYSNGNAANQYNTILTTPSINNQTTYIIKVQRLKNGTWAIYMDPFVAGMTTAQTISTSTTGTTGSGFSTYYYSYLEATATTNARFQWDDFNLYTRVLQFTAVGANSVSVNNITPSPLYPGQTNVIMYGLKIISRGNFNFNQIVFSTTGAGFEGYFNGTGNLYKTTNPFYTIAGATSVTSLSLTGNTASNYGFQDYITSSGNTDGSYSNPGYYFLVGNVNATLNYGNAPTGTIAFNGLSTLNGNADGNGTNGTAALSYSVTGSSTGNTMTFLNTVVPPTASNVSACGPGTYTITASGGNPSGGTYNWYSASSGGTALQSSASTTYAATVSSTTTFYVSYTIGGSTSTRTAVTVNVYPLPVISYATPQTYTVGTAITSLSPTVSGGTPTSYSISPALPTGLSFSTTTGVISGTATAAAAAANYTATATTASGCSGIATVNITVKPAAPTATGGSVCGSGTVTLTASGGTPAGGTYNWYAASSGGTALQSSTAAAYTTPSISSTTTYYVSYTSSSAESSRTAVTATVNPSPVISYATPPAYTVGTAITSLSPTVSGGTPTSYSISPALPAGLSLNTTTGVISGTPTTVTAAANYTVTAATASGCTGTAVISITVNPVPPAFSYASPQVYTVNSAITPLSPTNTGGAIGSYGAVSNFKSVNNSDGNTIDAAGNIYVTSKADNAVYIYNSSGTLIYTQNSSDGYTGALAYNNPAGIIVDAAGSTYVVNRNTGNIIKTTTGGVITAITGFDEPTDLAIDAAGNIYVVDRGGRTLGGAGSIYKLTTTSTTAGSAYVTGFSYPWGIAVNSTGDLFVSEPGPTNNINSIFKIAAGSTTSTTFVSTAAGLNSPRDMVFDAAGNLYEADAGSSNINMITPGGTVTTVLAIGGNSSPIAESFDSSGNMYISGYNYNTIYKSVASGYSISPTLPAGLNFNAFNGTVSGTPTVTSAATNYTVTGTNAGGSATAVINITVNPSAPSVAVSGSPGCGSGSVTFTASGGSPSGGTYNWYSSTTGAVIATGTTFLPIVSGTYYAAYVQSGNTSAKISAAAVINPIVSSPYSGAAFSYSFSGNTNDVSGNANNGVATGSPVLTTDRYGAANSAYNFNGSSQYISSTASVNNPNVFTLSLWFNTTTAGGKLLGFGNAQTGASGSYDRHIYMSNSGQLYYGIYQNSNIFIINTTASYNDGNWHHVVVTMGADGSTLYVDGTVQASNSSMTTGQNFTGYWRIGYDNFGSAWPNYPSNSYFTGKLDDVAVYNTELSAAQIASSNNLNQIGALTTVCAGSPVTFNAPTITGATYTWHDSGSGTQTGQNPTFPSAVAGNYTLTVTGGPGGCSSTATITPTVNPLPVISYATPQTYTVGIAITSLSPASTGAAPTSYAVSPALPAGLSMSTTTGAITGTATVAAAAANYTVTATTASGCTNTAVINITVKPPAPTATGGSTCGPGTVTLTASGGNPTGGTYNWYAASSGGTALQSTTATTYTTTSISSTTTYYVSYTSSGSESNRTAVTATVNPLPVISYATPQSYTVGTAITSLSPTVSGGSPTGYSVSPALPAGLSLSTTTGVISGTATAAAAATNYTVTATTASGCTGLATVNITVTPAAPTATGGSRCGTGTIILTASGGNPAGGTYNWYSASSGGTALQSTTATTYTTTSISSTTTYYVSYTSSGSESNRTAVTATVNPLPVISYATPQNYTVGTAITNLSPTVSGGSPTGYSVSPALPAGLSLNTTTGVISGTATAAAAATNYTVTATTASGCTGIATVTITVTPAAPTATGGSTCGPGTVTLTASGGTPTGGTYNWYAASSGGTALQSTTATTYTTTSISSTTTYYVSYTSSGSESNRTAVTATVNPLPTSTFTVTSPVNVGSNSTITFTGTYASTSTYTWNFNGGTTVSGSGVGPYAIQWSTPGNKTVSLLVTSSTGCTASSTQPVSVMPTAPTATGGSSCGTGSVALTASGNPSGGTFNWYAASVGGTALQSSTSTTYNANILVTTTYYVSYTVGGAESTRTPVTATINPVVTSPISNASFEYPFNGNANDISGNNNTGHPTYTSPSTAAPALSADRYGTAGSAYTFDGQGQYISTTTQYTNPQIFTLSLWFNTTTTSGGKLIGFDTNQPGPSSGQFDRHIYMNNSGQLYYGVYNSGVYTINSANSYNDGVWHHVIVTFGTTYGSVMYVDGAQVAANSAMNSAEPDNGYWRIGGDLLSGWPSTHTSNYFSGQIDDIGVYSTEFAPAQVTSANNLNLIGATGPVCAGSPITLYSQTITGATYTWHDSGGGTQTGQNPTFPSAVAGAYTLTVTGGPGGCSSTATITPIINASPIFSYATPQTYTVGTAISNLSPAVSGGTPVTYVISPALPAGLSISATAGVISGTPTAATATANYTVTATNSLGCTGLATINITVMPAAPTAAPVSRCGTGPVTLTASGGSPTGGTYNWYAASSGGTALQSSTSTAYTTPSISSTTTYYVSYTTGGVESNRTAVTATANPLPVISYTTPQNYTVGTAITSLSPTISGGTPASYSASPALPAGLSISSTTGVISGTPTAVTAATNYTITAATASGCTGSAIINITVMPAAPAAMGGSVCGTGAVTLTASGGTPAGGVYSWYASGSGGTALQATTSATYTPNIITTVNYYVSYTTGGVESGRTPVTAIVNPIVSSPYSGAAFSYPFSGNTNDVSGNANNGVATGSPTLIADRYNTANSAYNFNGSSQYISTTTAITSPTTFTISLWFNTTTAGGKLIGFGQNQTGANSVYDRNLFMSNTGQLYMGIYNGSPVAINTTNSYNDGNWHHVIVTVGASGSGTSLYVDGTLQASNTSLVPTVNYTGYWRIGYDAVSAYANAPSNPYFNGTLDDIAVYNRVLTSSEIASSNNVNQIGVGTATVCSPISFSAPSITGATYTWKDSGGTTVTGQNPTFTNAVAGNYTLTVTGGTGGCSSTVTLTPVINALPATTFTAASGTFINTSITVTLNTYVASSSYSWNFGGGTPSTGTGAGPFNVQWGTTGLKTITLTVTNSTGCTSTVSNTVNVNSANYGNYSYMRTITMNNAAVGITTNLANFPVLLSIQNNDLIISGACADKIQIPNGPNYDFAFVDPSSSTELYYQVENYNQVTGTLLVWVRLPSMNYATNNTLGFYYGSKAPPTTHNNAFFQNTWTSDYQAVYHFNEAGYTGTTQDGTANGRTATLVGFQTTDYTTAGKIGSAYQFGGTAGSPTVNDMEAATAPATSAFTLSAWVKMTTGGLDQKIITDQSASGNSSGGYKLGIYTNNIAETEDYGNLNRPAPFNNNPAPTPNAPTLNVGTWYYLQGVYNGSSISTYVNGVQYAVLPSTGSPFLTSTLYIGIGEGKQYPFSGLIDEPRVSNIAKSSDWLKMEYVDQNDPVSFTSVSSSVLANTPYAAAISGELTYTWTGATSTDPTVAANWSCPGTTNQVPAFDGSASLVIPSGLSQYPSLTADAGLYGLTVASGASLNLNGHTLSIGCHIYNSSGGQVLYNSSNTSGINWNGSLSNQYYYGSTTASTGQTGNMTVNNSAGGTVTISGGGLDVYNTLTMTKGNLAVGATPGALTLKSSAAQSASVAAIPAGSTIAGNVTVERFVTGGTLKDPSTGRWTYRSYRLMSSPVNEGIDGSGNYPYSLNYLNASTIITDVTSTYGTTPGNPSLYLYNEGYTPSNATFTSGTFEGVTNISSTTAAGTISTTDPAYPTGKMYAGDGFMIYFRGDNINSLSGVPSKTKAPFVAPENVVFSTTGNLNQGTYSVTSWTGTAGLMYTTTNPGNAPVRGYNLVGNPYASSIDWSLFSNSNTGAAIYGSNVNPSIYLLNPRTSNYDVYSASTGIATGNASNVIPSGAGFYVQANNSSPTLKFTEAAKTSAQVTGNNLLMGKPNTQTAYNSYMRVKLVTDTVNSDDIVVGFNSSSTMKFNPGEDSKYLNGGSALETLASITGDSVYASVKWLPLPKAAEQRIVPLHVTGKTSGIHTLQRTDLKQLPEIYEVWLMDKYKKDSLDIRHNTTYAFNLDLTDTASYGSNRFKVVIRQDPALAIHLLNFTATKASDGAQLVWKTENEQNYTNFTVERSTDGGKTFQVLGGLSSAGQGTYSFLDKNPQIAVDQYRLEIQDLDGTISYSKVIPLMYSALSNNIVASGISIYPNPATSNVNLYINNTTATSANSSNVSYNITVVNSTGTVIKTDVSSTPSWQYSVGSLIPGTYMIQVVNNNDKSLVGKGKFVKL